MLRVQRLWWRRCQDWGDEEVAALVGKLKSPIISLRLSCVKALGGDWYFGCDKRNCFGYWGMKPNVPLGRVHPN